MTVDVAVVPEEKLDKGTKESLGAVEPKDADCIVVFDIHPFERLSSVVSEYDSPVIGCVSADEVSDAVEAGADDFLVVDDEDDIQEGPLREKARLVVERQEVADDEKTLERIDDGFVKLDEDWSIAYVNSRAEELLGRPEDELLGESVWEEFPEAVDEEFYDELHRAVEEGEPASFEAYNETVDEWFEVKAYPSDDGLYLYFNEVTERVEHEERLSSLLEHTRQLMRAGSKEEVAEYVVEASAETLGFGVNGVHLVEGDILEPAAVTDETLEVMGEPYSFEVGEGLIGEPFGKEETRQYEDLSEMEKDYGVLKSAVIVPIDGYGTVGIGSTDADDFDAKDVSAIEILAENAASAMHRAEREEALARYETVVENVQDMMYVADNEGYFSLVTQPLAEFLGYDREELVGELAVSVMEEGEEYKAREGAKKLLEEETEGSITVETRLVSKGGEKLPVEVEVNAMPEEFGGTVGVVRDISDLVSALESLESERDRFGYLFSNINDPVLEVELNGEPCIVSANPSYIDHFGMVEEGDVVERKEVRALLEDDHSTEVERETDEGRRYYIFQGVRYGSDDRKRGFCLYTDMTERRRKRQHLRVINRVLRHNLRNSANSMMGSADRISEKAREKGDEETETLASAIYDSALSLADVSDEAREIERVMQGASPSRSIDISEIFKEIDQSYPSVEVDAEAPVVDADGYLHDAVDELVANAIEHNPPDTHVKLSAKSVGGYVEVRVEDDGEGIPKEEVRIVGGDEDVSQTQHASGLGLWKVRWTAESYGGELCFDTDEDGTTATIKIPQ